MIIPKGALWAIYIPDIRGAVGIYSTLEKAAQAVVDAYRGQPGVTYEAVLAAFTDNPGYRYFAPSDVWATALYPDYPLELPCID